MSARHIAGRLSVIAATTALAAGGGGAAWACGGGGIAVASGFGNLFTVFSAVTGLGYSMGGVVSLIRFLRTPGITPLHPTLKRFTLGGVLLGIPFLADASGYRDPAETVSWIIGTFLGVNVLFAYIKHVQTPKQLALKSALTPAGFSAFFLGLPLVEELANLVNLVPFAGFLAGGAFFSLAGLFGLRRYFRDRALPLRPSLVRVVCGFALLALFATVPAVTAKPVLANQLVMDDNFK